jgi:NAD(P)-dependent dehydrogenase (short-subunit alcohol dehydrogenase family)
LKVRTILVGAAAAAGAAALAWKASSDSGGDSLAGEVVVITGGSRGLGLALAREFGRQQCRVAICARDSAELKVALDELERRGIEAADFVCDVTVESQVRKMIEAVVARFGQVDILVNNAGVIEVGPVESFGIEDFEEAMKTIFWGTVYATLIVLPQMMARQRGRIVNISSVGGKVGVPHLTPYVSAKFAVAGFSQALAAEMRPHGIRVTAIFPGLMRTGSFAQAKFKGQQVKEAEWFTLGATLPGISMDATRAARQIVNAVKHGDREKTLSLPAQAIALMNGLFPGGVTQILSKVASVILPDPAKSANAKKGSELWRYMSPAVRSLSALGLQAMRNYNQRA